MSKKTYLVTFTPSGPYFFGNEKTFSFTKSKESLYFIRGEKLPSQSTILGALRYLALSSVTNGNPAYADARDHADLIGGASFNIEWAGSTPQSFGAIRSISPLFLYGPEEKKKTKENSESGSNEKPDEYRMLIPTPFDHNYGAEKEAKKKHDREQNEAKFRFRYTPFTDYRLTQDARLYMPEYDSKSGIADSFVSLSKDKATEGYEIIDTVDEEGKVYLFGSEVRVGVNLNEKNDGFFKKEYCTLAKGYSFAVYAELDESVFSKMTGALQTVMLGQGKVPFSVKFEEHENKLQTLTGQMLEDTHGFLPANQTIVYCMGDMLAGEERKDSLFSVVQTKDYRAYLTGSGGKDADHIAKGENLHKLIRAGSVFLLESEKASDNWGKSTQEQENAETIGFNQTAQYRKKKGE